MLKAQKKSSISAIRLQLTVTLLTISTLTYAANDEKYIQVSFEFLVGLFVVLLVIVFAPLFIMFFLKRNKVAISDKEIR